MQSSAPSSTLTATAPTAVTGRLSLAASVAADMAPTSDDRYWFEEDLSIEELEATVAVINAAVRASRK